MTDKIRQMILCMAAALVLGAVGTSARAAFYSPVFDPEFNGNVVFFIPDPCLAQADSIYPSTGSCQVDLFSASIFEVDPLFPMVPIGPTYTSGLQSNIGLFVLILSNALNALSTTSMTLSCGIECGTGALQFFITEPGCEGECSPFASFTIGERTLRAFYTLVEVADPRQVPEPGTLGLIIGGLFVAWRLSRRKTAR